jgi:hypothetical protein
MQRLHIFRAGSHSPMQGGVLEFAASDLAATAAAYDPARHEAPIVVGHPALNAPAYGWVASLSAEGEDLVATPRQVDADFAAMVKAGRFKKISASFFSPNARDNPTPGVWSLRHVGFLGAAPPAVQGLREVAFSAEAEGVTTIEFAAPSASMLGWLLGDMASLFRGIRDRFIADVGAAEADRLLPGTTVQRIAEEAARMQAMPEPAAAPAFAQPLPEEPNLPETDAAAREAALNAREAELAARETRLAEAATLRRTADAADFAQRLVREARLPQGQAPRAAALLASLPDEGVVSFAAPTEGAAPIQEAPAAALRALLAALPPAVSFAGVNQSGPGTEAPVDAAEFAGMRVDPDRFALHRRALAYQAAHPGTEYLTAVRAVEGAVH